MNNYVLRTPTGMSRPVTEEDAEFIVKLRNQQQSRFIHKTSPDVENQRQWIREYLKRDNEYYWITETNDHVLTGTHSLYHYVAERQEIESGRWVRMAGAPSGNMFAGRIQINDFVFRDLGMKRLVFDTAVTNKQVRKYHNICGAIEERIEHDGIILNGEPVDLVWFVETPESWEKVRPRIVRLAGLENFGVDDRYGTIERI